MLLQSLFDLRLYILLLNFLHNFLGHIIFINFSPTWSAKYFNIFHYFLNFGLEVQANLLLLRLKVINAVSIISQENAHMFFALVISIVLLSIKQVYEKICSQGLSTFQLLILFSLSLHSEKLYKLYQIVCFRYQNLLTISLFYFNSILYITDFLFVVRRYLFTYKLLYFHLYFMVRLEKIAYEQIVNSKALGRARNLTTPAKWFTTNPNEHEQRMSYNFFHKTLLGKVLKPFYQLWFNYERNFQRSILLQQGLTFQDKYLHHDAELRRQVLFEHIARESLHPYHWVLKARRRQRYYRIQRGNRGFFVPQFIQNETKTQTYRDYRRLLNEWFAFTHNNYWSDITPSARRTVIPILSPFDLMMNYGIWRPEAWERYFFTERDQGWCTQKQVKFVRDPKKFPFDLTTSEGKRQFESQITSVNSKYPGLVAPQGQKFDFAKYYAQIGV